MPMMAQLENVLCCFMMDAEEKDSGKLAMKSEMMNIADSLPLVARNPISTDSGTPSATIPASIPSASEAPPALPSVGVPYFMRIPLRDMMCDLANLTLTFIFFQRAPARADSGGVFVAWPTVF